MSSTTKSELLSIYAHIPFCAARCTYCAFNIIVGREDLIPRFVEALQREIQLVATPNIDAQTLYFGGGTPSMLTPEQVHTLISTAQQNLGLRPDSEITLEANPDDAEHFTAYREAGVNRLSIGVQSAHQHELDLFGRAHTFREAEAAFHHARDAGFDNISVDLIFGAPYQTLPGWQETLDQVITWGADNFSLYSLILERGTRLTRHIEAGKLPPPDDDLAADMYQYARQALAAAGCTQYEIASWSRPGFESVHNLQYWRGLPYLGLGPGAHGFVESVRYWNMRPVSRYIERMMGGSRRAFPFSPAVEGHESIDEHTAMVEAMFLGLRMVQEGVCVERFEERFGCSPFDVFGTAIECLQAKNLLIERDGRLLLPEHAYLISNQVFVEFMPS